MPGHFGDGWNCIRRWIPRVQPADAAYGAGVLVVDGEDTRTDKEGRHLLHRNHRASERMKKTPLVPPQR